MTHWFVLQILKLGRAKKLFLGPCKVGEMAGTRAIGKPSYKDLWHFMKCKKSGEMQKVQMRSANDCQIVTEGMRVHVVLPGVQKVWRNAKSPAEVSQ